MFVSYAQNYEDVILYRALKNIKEGFYIDIGAQDPITDSVSKSFYELGWRGVHIEPNRFFARKLRQARPDETVLELAIGAYSGVIDFYEFDDSGCSSCLKSVKDAAEELGYRAAQTQVQCIHMSDLLNRYAGKEIHWLKIDVEGAEAGVIKSWLPSTVRPWIVIVESTVPLTQTPSHDVWEADLINLNYEFVYFDGLNRFYVSEQKRELAKYFGPGPNIFDHFVLASFKNSEESLVNCQRNLVEAQDRLLTYAKSQTDVTFSVLWNELLKLLFLKLKKSISVSLLSTHNERVTPNQHRVMNARYKNMSNLLNSAKRQGRG